MEQNSTVISSFSKDVWESVKFNLAESQFQDKDFFFESVNSEVLKSQYSNEPLNTFRTNPNISSAPPEVRSLTKLDIIPKLTNNRFSNKSSFNYSTVSQKWMGYIVSLNDMNFEARLKDLTNGGTDEEVEISINEISPDDRDLIDIGAVFYWSIGKEMRNGQLINESVIRFKRSPWLVEDFDEAMDSADDLFAGLEWD